MDGADLYGKVLLFVALIIAAVLVAGLFVMLIYNETELDELVGGPEMTYAQGVGVAAILIALGR
jgi:hypothetical protein